MWLVLISLRSPVSCSGDGLKAYIALSGEVDMSFTSLRGCSCDQMKCVRSVRRSGLHNHRFFLWRYCILADTQVSKEGRHPSLAVPSFVILSIQNQNQPSSSATTIHPPQIQVSPFY